MVVQTSHYYPCLDGAAAGHPAKMIKINLGAGELGHLVSAFRDVTHERINLDNVAAAGHGIGNPEHEEQGAVNLAHEGLAGEPVSGIVKGFLN